MPSNSLFISSYQGQTAEDGKLHERYLVRQVHQERKMAVTFLIHSQSLNDFVESGLLCIV